MKTCKRTSVTNSILWATAIISGAMLGAGTFFTLIILPVLAVISITNLTLSKPG